MLELEKIGFYTLSDERVKNTSEFSQMKRGEIIILEACNFRCPYCRGLKNEIYGDRKVKMLSLDEVKYIIDLWCDNEPIENIRFSGGEPTLHPQIREIVSYAKLKGVKRIAISTNGASSLELYKELVELGVNDFSVSLDACCAEDAELMSGGIKGAFDKIVASIKLLSSLTYVTVGVVLTPENVQKTIDTIKFADSLGVGDIRIISSAQWNSPITALGEVPEDLMNKYPILKYRVDQFRDGLNVRGMSETDSKHCALVLDDSAIAGRFTFPCIIYMREQGQAICEVGPDMRAKRVEWFKNHDCYEDPICRKNCLDVCRFFNRRYEEFHENI